MRSSTTFHTEDGAPMEPTQAPSNVQPLPAQAASPIRVDRPTDQLPRVKRSETLLRIDQVEARVGFRKSKIYALAKDEPLLRPVRISARCVAWPESRIDAYIAQVIAQADGMAGELVQP